MVAAECKCYLCILVLAGLLIRSTRHTALAKELNHHEGTSCNENNYVLMNLKSCRMPAVVSPLLLW